MTTAVASLLVVLALLAGCGQPATPSAPAATDLASAPPHERPSFEAFGFIGPGVTIQDVFLRVGPPDGDIGSGIHVYVYRLTDGSELLVGSTDGTSILYVRRGDAVIYQRE